MLKIGLTGGIGSGKTTVSHIFRALGVPVFDADTAAKTLMNENESLKQHIIAHFGAPAYENGLLNRKYLANIVFNDAFQLEKLNAIVHPASIQAGLDWAAQQQAPYIIKEAALMFEAASGFNLDYIIGVFAPQHIRIQRVMKRDKVSREEVLNRMNKQINEHLKMKLCDFVLHNNEQTLLVPQVLALHEQFLQKATQHSA